MAVRMLATSLCPPRHGTPGKEMDVSTSCVRFFREQGWAILADEVKQVREKEETEMLSAEYERLTGMQPDARWKAETLERKVEEAKRTYRRRDMRAED